MGYAWTLRWYGIPRFKNGLIVVPVISWSAKQDCWSKNVIGLSLQILQNNIRSDRLS